MGWKIFFGLLAVLYAYGLKDLANPASLSVLQWARLPIDAVVLLGLFGYAFRREILTSLFWWAFTAVFVVVDGLGFKAVYDASVAQRMDDSVLIGAFVLMLLFSVPTVVALLLYAARLSRPAGQPVPTT